MVLQGLLDTEGDPGTEGALVLIACCFGTGGKFVGHDWLAKFAVTPLYQRSTLELHNIYNARSFYGFATVWRSFASWPHVLSARSMWLSLALTIQINLEKGDLAATSLWWPRGLYCTVGN